MQKLRVEHKESISELTRLKEDPVLLQLRVENGELKRKISMIKEVACNPIDCAIAPKSANVDMARGKFSNSPIPTAEWQVDLYCLPSIHE